MTVDSSPTTIDRGRLDRAVAHRWPSLVGVAFGALIVFDLTDGVGLAPVLAITAAVYVGAAALGRPAAAWPLLIGTSALLTVVRLWDPPLDATWIIVSVAVLLLAFGLARGAWDHATRLPRQTAALLVFGGTALAALAVDVRLGSYLVAAGLIGHAAWDALHHRTNRTVTRSFAEFCFVLDLVLAAAIIVVTVD